MPNEGPIVSIVTFDVRNANFADVARTAGDTVQRLPALAGFIQGTVLANEDNTRIVVMTEWTSRESWAKAEWNDEIARAVADLYQISASYDLKFLFPLVSVKGASV